MSALKLTGNKIDLREISIEDTPIILRWRNSNSVKEHFIYQETLTKEQHENWLKTQVYTHKTAQFIIIESSSNYEIGSAYLRDIDRKNSKAELGIYIGEIEYLGKGYGREVILLLLKYGFEKLKLNKIFLRVLKENANAIKAYEKVGFEVEGIFKEDVKINDEYRDVVFMSILNKENGKVEF